MVVVISGPSGVGKDTILERMAECGFPHHFAITATTRPPRPGEQEGVNHFFLSREKFEELIAQGELLEHAEVYGNLYGVPRQQVRDALANGKHVLIRVDVQGATRIRELLPDSVLIYVTPPDMETLRKHLIARGADTEEEIQRRLDRAAGELRSAQKFDYRIVNHESRLDDAVKQVTGIIEREAHSVPARVFDV